MAIFFLELNIIKRAKGRSSVAAAAYRARAKLHNEREGLTHDYTEKGGVSHSEILLPENAPEEYANRQALWNAVELAEQNRNAQTARDIVIALPTELDHAAHVSLMRDYARSNFVDKGMVADLNLHGRGTDNPHAHIMLTMRPFDPDGTWGAKSSKEYVLDGNGERIKLNSGEWKSKKVPATDWDNHENLEKWREDWADRCNAEFERRGLDVRIDHRSNERQGIDREAYQHMGHAASAMERKGIQTEKGDINRAIDERNRAREQEQRPPRISKTTGKPVPYYDEWEKDYNDKNPPEREKCQEIERDR